jgi:cysteine dioxygenase
VQIDRCDVEDFCVFNPLCYARNPVASSEHYELLCICWLPDQSSLIHDHTGSACGVRVVVGEMTETIFEHVSEQSALRLRLVRSGNPPDQ